MALGCQACQGFLDACLVAAIHEGFDLGDNLTQMLGALAHQLVDLGLLHLGAFL